MRLNCFLSCFFHDVKSELAYDGTSESFPYLYKFKDAPLHEDKKECSIY